MISARNNIFTENNAVVRLSHPPHGYALREKTTEKINPGDLSNGFPALGDALNTHKKRQPAFIAERAPAADERRVDECPIDDEHMRTKARPRTHKARPIRFCPRAHARREDEYSAGHDQISHNTTYEVRAADAQRCFVSTEQYCWYPQHVQHYHEELFYHEHHEHQEQHEQKSDEQHEEHEQQSHEQQRRIYGQQTYEQQTYEQQTYEQQTYEQQTYEQQMYEQQMYEQQMYEQQVYEQQMYEQQMYEQQMPGQMEGQRSAAEQLHASGHLNASAEQFCPSTQYSSGHYYGEKSDDGHSDGGQQEKRFHEQQFHEQQFHEQLEQEICASFCASMKRCSGPEAGSSAPHYYKIKVPFGFHGFPRSRDFRHEEMNDGESDAAGMSDARVCKEGHGAYTFTEGISTLKTALSLTIDVLGMSVSIKGGFWTFGAEPQG